MPPAASLIFSSSLDTVHPMNTAYLERQLVRALDEVDCTPSTLPDWLTATPPPRRPTPVARDLEQVMFESMFERVLDLLTQGRPLKTILKEDLRQPDYARFLKWVMADPSRKNRYYEAQETASEVVSTECIEIADATDSPMEDVQRSKLRIDTRRFLVGVWNRKRFGEVKQIELNGGINLRTVLEQAQARVIDGCVREIEE